VTRDQIEEQGIEQLHRLTGVKWTRDEPDVIPAWVADMDLKPPPVVVDAIRAVIDRNDFGYNRQASAQLADTFTAWQRSQHGWSPDPGRVRTFCDVLHAIDVALWLHTEPGDGVVLLTPIYHPFLMAVNNSGRRVVDVPLDPEGFGLDPERLRAAIDSGTKAILMCNPHNPTGRVFTEQELRAIGEVAIENDLLLLSDEVWADLVYPGATHIPTESLGPEVAAKTITISAASKAFNLAGMRCAVAHFGHDGLNRQFEELPTHFLGAVSTTGAEATMAAWTAGGPWLASLLRHLAERRDQLTARLAAELPAVGYQPPQATYLGWLDFRALELGPDPTERLLADGRIALSPGPAFGPPGVGHARVNFATSASILDELIDRMVKVAGG